MIHYSKKGFTLFEVILVLAILAIMSTISFLYLGGYKLSADLEESAGQLSSKLREAQNKSMIGENNSSWGIHFDNITSTDPFIELFYGSSYPGTIVEKTYLAQLSPSIRFQAPSSGTSLNIVFSKITGKPASQQSAVIYSNSAPGTTKTITVETSGRITIQ